jgi:uncharacterized repeat protein (TIGR03803 family)
MTRSEQIGNGIGGLDLWMTLVATAIATLLIVAATPAHAQTLTVLYNFGNGPVGSEPDSGLIVDHTGSLYGTTYDGGTQDYGTVYRLSRAGSGWTVTPLYSFLGGTDGAYPVADVAFGPNGTLYGTTSGGGNGGYGTVFNLRPPASVCKTVLCPWTETVLYRFTGGSDGGFGNFPYGYADVLVFDRAGNVYGTTPNGGAYGYGVVFKLTQSGGSWTESVLWSFTGGDDGANPLSGVIFDSAGNLYGTAESGGTHGEGVVYELSPSESGWTQSTLYSFVLRTLPTRSVASPWTRRATSTVLLAVSSAAEKRTSCLKLMETGSLAEGKSFPPTKVLSTLPPSMQKEISTGRSPSPALVNMARCSS